MEILKKYYLDQLIGFLILFSILIFSTAFERGIEFRDILIVIIGSIILSIFVGGIYHFYDQIIKPKRETKLFNHQNLFALQNFGMKKEEDFYNKYFLMISFVSSPDEGEWINISTPIIVTEDNLEFVKSLSKKYELSNSGDLSFINMKIPKLFKMPSTEKIWKKTEKFIEDLIINNIKPAVIKN